jgi:MFS superfamily sulfate permease-like transporter
MMWLGPSDYVRTRVKGLAVSAGHTNWLVPLIDASGVTALKQLLKRCARSGTRVILSGLREQPKAILLQMGLKPDGKDLQFAEDFASAIAFAEAGQL